MRGVERGLPARSVEERRAQRMLILALTTCLLASPLAAQDRILGASLPPELLPVPALEAVAQATVSQSGQPAASPGTAPARSDRFLATNGPTPPVERDQGGGAVLLGALVGAGASLVGIFAFSFMNPEFNEGNVPLLYGTGITLGAMAGAALEDREPAPVWTLTGTAAGLVPMVTWMLLDAPEGWGIPVFVAPIVGGVLGNVYGQDHEPRPGRW